MTVINSPQEFKKTLEENERVLVDFYADWCGPCKMMAPLFEQASKEVTGVTFAKLNVDVVTEVAQEFQIFSIPTTIAFLKGKMVGQPTPGFMPKEQIIKLANTLKGE